MELGYAKESEESRKGHLFHILTQGKTRQHVFKMNLNIRRIEGYVRAKRA